MNRGMEAMGGRVVKRYRVYERDLCKVPLSMDRSEFLKASPPMFKSGLLDKFTRVHHVVPVVIFAPGDRAPVRDRRRPGRAAGRRSAYAVGGYLFWTLAEYWIHRVVFHFEPEDGLGARLHWMVHGVHHDHPNDPLRLVMPPAASVPLALIFYALVLARARRRARVRRSAPASWPATSPTT